MGKICIDKITHHWWATSSPGWAVSVLSAFPSYERCSSLFIILVALHWTLQYVHVSYVPGSPTLNPVLTSIEGEDHFPRPGGNTLSNAVKNTISFLCGKGTLLTQKLIGKDTQSLPFAYTFLSTFSLLCSLPQIIGWTSLPFSWGEECPYHMNHIFGVFICSSLTPLCKEDSHWDRHCRVLLH